MAEHHGLLWRASGDPVRPLDPAVARRFKILRWCAGALLAGSAIYLIVAAVGGRALWPLWLMTGAGAAAFASSVLSPTSIRAREYLMIVMCVLALAATTVIVIARP